MHHPAPTTHVIIRYRVKPDRLEEHLGLLGAVFTELAAAAPPGLAWSSYRLPDDTGFMDVVAVERPGRLSELSSWAPYRSTLDERCDDPPVITEVELVGAF